jgi:hypothetical protein
VTLVIFSVDDTSIKNLHEWIRTLGLYLWSPNVSLYWKKMSNKSKVREEVIRFCYPMKDRIDSGFIIYKIEAWTFYESIDTVCRLS